MLELRLHNTLALVGVLYREQLYLSLKATSPGLRPDKLARAVRHAKARYIALSFFVALGVLMTALSPLVVATTSEEEIALTDALRASGFLYTTMAFTMTFMLCAWSTFIAQEHGLLRPLSSLPLGQEDLRLLALLTAINNALPVAITPPIYGALVAYLAQAPLAGLAAAIYGYASTFFALAISLALAALLAKRRSGQSFRARLARALRTFIFVFCMGLFFVVSQASRFLLPLLSQMTGPLGVAARSLWFAYPFSAAEAPLLLSGSSLGQQGLMALCLAGAYLGLSYAVFSRAFTRYWHGIVAPTVVTLETARPRARLRAPSRLTMRPVLGILIKDMKLAYRDPRTAYLLFMPLFMLIMIVPTVLADEVSVLAMSTFMGMAIIMLPSGACQLLVAEGDKFWALFSSGLRKKELALGKALVSSLAYAAYALPIGLGLACLTGSWDCLAFLAASTLVAFAASATATRYLARHVGPETKMVQLTVARGLAILGIAFAFQIPFTLVSMWLGPAGAMIAALAEAGLTLLILSAR